MNEESTDLINLPSEDTVSLAYLPYSAPAQFFSIHAPPPNLHCHALADGSFDGEHYPMLVPLLSNLSAATLIIDPVSRWQLVRASLLLVPSGDW